MTRILNLLVLGVSVALVIALGFAVRSFGSSTGQSTLQPPPPLESSTAQSAEQLPSCPEDWFKSEDAELMERCAIAKEARDETTTSIEYTQASLRPTAYVTPAPTVPAEPGSIRTEPQVRVERLDPIEFFDGDVNLRHSTSIWRFGVVPGRMSYDEMELYVLSFPPRECVKACIAVIGNGMTQADTDRYCGMWLVPQDVGELTITDITNAVFQPNGVSGLAIFSTTTGLTGTFDLATHVWTFSNAATPTP